MNPDSTNPGRTNPESTTRSAATTITRPLLILLAGVAVAAALYLLRPVDEKKVIEPPRLMVDAIEVVRETVQLKVATHGTVSASTETRLAAEVTGRITKVAENFVVGGFFNTGDTLLQIDDLEYRTEVKRAEAKVASARTRLAEEKGRAEVAYNDWLRRNPDVKRSDEATELALRKPQVEEAEANLQAALAELAKAQEDLARTLVTAPYDGILRARSADLGQHVSVGQELGVMFSTDRMEVRLPVPEHKLATLELPGLDYGDALDLENENAITAQLSVDINGETKYWQAQITRSEGVLDPRSRVLYLIATVEDPYQLKVAHGTQRTPLRLGTFVNADINGKVANNVVRVPHHVLRTDNKVWIIDDSGNMHERPVEIVSTDREFTYLSAGLSDGDKIAMGYLDTSISGARVGIAKLVKLPPLGPNTLPEPGSKQPEADLHNGVANKAGIGDADNDPFEEPVL